MTRLARRRRRLRRFARAYPTVASLAGPQPAGACEAAPGEVHAGAATFVVPSLSVPASSGAVRAELASAWGYAPATARGGALPAAPGVFAAPVHAPGARAAGPVVAPSATVPAFLLAGGAWTWSAAGPVSGEPHCPAPTAHGAGRSRVPVPSADGGHPAPRSRGPDQTRPRLAGAAEAAPVVHAGAADGGPGRHFAAGQALAAPGLARAASLGRRWRRLRRFIGRRAVEVRVFLMVTAAGLALLSLISPTAPDVDAPYEMHVDNGYQEHDDGP